MKKTIIEKVTGLIINDEHQALTRYFAGEIDRTGIPAGQFSKSQRAVPRPSGFRPVAVHLLLHLQPHRIRPPGTARYPGPKSIVLRAGPQYHCQQPAQGGAEPGLPLYPFGNGRIQSTGH